MTTSIPVKFAKCLMSIVAGTSGDARGTKTLTNKSHLFSVDIQK